MQYMDIYDWFYKEEKTREIAFQVEETAGRISTTIEAIRDKISDYISGGDRDTSARIENEAFYSLFKIDGNGKFAGVELFSVNPTICVDFGAHREGGDFDELIPVQDEIYLAETGVYDDDETRDFFGIVYDSQLKPLYDAFVKVCQEAIRFYTELFEKHISGKI